MNTLLIPRPAAAPTASPVLDRLFAAAPARFADNDTSPARNSLLVRRRERQRRRDAR
ncbi:hypothetical protein [Hyphomonas sp.]|uniref:hypothetical protein n=1 Tax=Hyphomonas sp. TaxID=87 RepID=UPI00391C5FE5